MSCNQLLTLLVYYGHDVIDHDELFACELETVNNVHQLLRVWALLSEARPSAIKLKLAFVMTCTNVDGHSAACASSRQAFCS